MKSEPDSAAEFLGGLVDDLRLVAEAMKDGR